MTVLEMTRQVDDFVEDGTLYIAKIALGDTETSPAVWFPVRGLQDIAVMDDGATTYSYELTNSPKADIEGDTAIWAVYDGISEINKGCTAIRFTNLEATSGNLVVSVRTSPF